MSSLAANRRSHALRREYWFGTAPPGVSLALFRIVFGLLCLRMALYTLPLAEPLYSDAGVLPRALLTGNLANRTPSLLLLFGSPGAVRAFAVCWALVAVALIAGLQTRMAQILNFVALVSLLHRNPFFISGADMVFKTLGFWTLFLPLGARWSLDARRRTGAPRPLYLFPLRMVQLQIGLVYLFAGAFKLPSAFWLGGDALFHALQKINYVRPLGEWALLHIPLPLLRLLTWTSLAWELLFVFLLFSPLYQPWLRRAALLLGVAFHAGVALLLVTNHFSAIMLTSYLLLVDEPAAQALPPTLEMAAFWRRGPTGRLWLTAFLGLTMVAVIWVNLRGFAPRWVPRVAEPARSLLLTTGLTQRWQMFEMRGDTVDEQSLVTVGIAAGGAEYELLRRRPLDERPNRWSWGPDVRYITAASEIATLAWARESWARYFCGRTMDDGQPPTAVEVRLRVYETVAADRFPPAAAPTAETRFGPLACP